MLAAPDREQQSASMSSARPVAVPESEGENRASRFEPEPQNDRGSPRFSAIAFRAISFVIGPIRNSRASRQ